MEEGKDNMGAVHSDCEGRPVFVLGGGATGHSTYMTKKTVSVCRVCVNMGQSVF